MVRRISMNFTLPAFVADKKSVTRRYWKDSYAKGFNKHDVLSVVDKLYKDGQVIGTLMLTEKPYRENTFIMNDMDYIWEGFGFLDRRYDAIEGGMPLVDVFERWRAEQGMVWVVPFEILSVEDWAREKYTSDDEILRSVRKLVEAIG